MSFINAWFIWFSVIPIVAFAVLWASYWRLKSFFSRFLGCAVSLSLLLMLIGDVRGRFARKHKLFGDGFMPLQLEAKEFAPVNMALSHSDVIYGNFIVAQMGSEKWAFASRLSYLLTNAGKAPIVFGSIPMWQATGDDVFSYKEQICGNRFCETIRASVATVIPIDVREPGPCGWLFDAKKDAEECLGEPIKVSKYVYLRKILR